MVEPSSEFVDMTGERWRLIVDDGAIERIKSQFGLNIVELATGGMVEFRTMAYDEIERLADIIAVLLEPEIERRRMSVGDFYRRMNQGSLVAATEAVLGSLTELAMGSPAQRVAFRRSAIELIRAVRESEKPKPEEG